MVQRFRKFAWTVLGFNLLVILWGALVRASHSGEGCGDHWPLCNGTVIPHAAEIATIIEFTHRATTGVAFFATVAMAVWSRIRWKGQPVARAAMASLVLIVTEALLGAGLVLFNYSGKDASFGRAAYLSAHLLNTLLMLAAMALTAWWASGHTAPEWSRMRGKAGLAVALLIGLTGATAALSETLFPATSLREGLAADFSSAEPWLVRTRILHPLVATLGGLYILLLTARTGAGRRIGHVVMGLVVLQLGAGVVNLVMLAPVWTQLVHLLLADLLWLALVLFAAE